MCCDDCLGDYRTPRILSWFILFGSFALIIGGLVTPDWTEIGGSYWWEHNTNVPLILTASRFFVLMACFGVVIAEILYLGAVCMEQIPLKIASVSEAVILFLSTFMLMLGLVLFGHYSREEELGAYGYSFWITVCGNLGLLLANMLAVLDIRLESRKEGYEPT